MKRPERVEMETETCLLPDVFVGPQCAEIAYDRELIYWIVRFENGVRILAKMVRVTLGSYDVIKTKSECATWIFMWEHSYSPELQEHIVRLKPHIPVYTSTERKTKKPGRKFLWIYGFQLVTHEAVSLPFRTQLIILKGAYTVFM